jgi:pilus assembly protein CpaF
MTEIAFLARKLVKQSVAPELAVDLAIDSVAATSDFTLEAEREFRATSRNESLGLGVLQQFIDDETIEEIWINRPNEIFLARSGQVERKFLALGETQLAGLVERMLRSTGRRLDRTSPFVDAALPDGSRLHVVIPEISRKYWAVNIRKFPSGIWSMSALVSKGVLAESSATWLASAARAGRNILVSGGTHTGKTTMLCALIAETRESARLVTVEETFEIRAAKDDWVAMQTRQSSIEGTGEVSLRRLVKESLRMRPDLLVVGEVREAESLDLLIAMNSGTPAMCTIHANSASEAVTKLCTLPLLAGANISAEFVKQTVIAALDIVVHCSIDEHGNRKVLELAEITKTPDGNFAMNYQKSGDW